MTLHLYEQLGKSLKRRDGTTVEGIVPFGAEPAVIQAAIDTFGRYNREQIADLTVLPFDRCWFEWTNDGARCGVFARQFKLDPASPDFDAEGGDAEDYNRVADKRLLELYISFVDDRWDSTPKGIEIQQMQITWCPETGDFSYWLKEETPPEEAQEVADKFVRVITCLVALLNAPECSEREEVDFSRLNKSRRRMGRAERTSYTKIKLTQQMKDWIKCGGEKNYVDEHGRHMVRRHPHTYLVGEGRQKVMIKWVGPYHRGNKAKGSKEPGYALT